MLGSFASPATNLIGFPELHLNWKGSRRDFSVWIFEVAVPPTHSLCRAGNVPLTFYFVRLHETCLHYFQLSILNFCFLSFFSVKGIYEYSFCYASRVWLFYLLNGYRC